MIAAQIIGMLARGLLGKLGLNRPRHLYPLTDCIDPTCPYNVTAHYTRQCAETTVDLTKPYPHGRHREDL